MSSTSIPFEVNVFETSLQTILLPPRPFFCTLLLGWARGEWEDGAEKKKSGVVEWEEGIKDMDVRGLLLCE